MALIKLGADPAAVDEEGSTLLHAACQQGNLLVTRYLLDSCGLTSQLKVRNDAGLTPLEVACGEGHAGLIGLLIEDYEVEPNAEGAVPSCICGCDKRGCR